MCFHCCYFETVRTPRQHSTPTQNLGQEWTEGSLCEVYLVHSQFLRIQEMLPEERERSDESRKFGKKEKENKIINIPGMLLS